MPRPKKYQTKHNLVRKHIPKDFWQITDIALDTIKKFIDKTSGREAIYIMSYIAAVILSYRIITGITLKFRSIFYAFGHLLGLAPTLTTDIGIKLFPDPDKDPELDIQHLLTAMVAAYIVLKIDVDDVVSATKIVTSTVTKIMAV